MTQNHWNTKLVASSKKKEEAIKKDPILEALYLNLQPQIKIMAIKDLAEQLTKSFKKSIKENTTLAGFEVYFRASENNTHLHFSRTVINLMKSKSDSIENGIFLFPGNGNSKNILVVLRMGVGQGETLSIKDSVHYELAVVIPKKYFKNGKKIQTEELIKSWRRYLNPLLYHRYQALTVRNILI